MMHSGTGRVGWLQNRFQTADGEDHAGRADQTVSRCDDRDCPPLALTAFAPERKERSTMRCWNLCLILAAVFCAASSLQGHADRPKTKASKSASPRLAKDRTTGRTLPSVDELLKANRINDGWNGGNRSSFALEIPDSLATRSDMIRIWQGERSAYTAQIQTRIDEYERRAIAEWAKPRFRKGSGPRDMIITYTKDGERLEFGVQWLRVSIFRERRMKIRQGAEVRPERRPE